MEGISTAALTAYSPDEADYMAFAQNFIAAALWFQPRSSELRSVAKYHGDHGASALVKAHDTAADHLLAGGLHSDDEVFRFIALVNAAKLTEAAHA